MRLIKANSTNLKNFRGKGVRINTNDEIVMESDKTVKVPIGTTADRPQTPENGMMRYNSTTNLFEFYVAGQWLNIGTSAPGNIVQQNLGVGDDAETVFGPLDSGDAQFPVPATAQSVLVFVENVFQIATTNYTLVQNPGGFDPGFYLQFGSPPPLGRPVTVLHNFDK